MRTRASLVVGLVLVTGILLAGCGAGTSTTTTRPSEPGVEDPEVAAPEFTFTTFQGNTFSLAEQRGTPVVLNFWESW